MRRGGATGNRTPGPGLQPQARILDAAGGGRPPTLRTDAQAQVLALDVDEARCGASPEPAAPGAAQVRTADASEPSYWWDSKPFDAILLDAPAASGIVRRRGRALAAPRRTSSNSPNSKAVAHCAVALAQTGLTSLALLRFPRRGDTQSGISCTTARLLRPHRAIYARHAGTGSPRQFAVTRQLLLCGAAKVPHWMHQPPGCLSGVWSCRSAACWCRGPRHRPQVNPAEVTQLGGAQR